MVRSKIVVHRLTPISCSQSQGVDSDERDHVLLKRSRLFGAAGYFATQVMDWKPLQTIVLQRALCRSCESASDATIPPMTKMKRRRAKLKASVQCSIARLRARDPRILRTLLLPSELSHPASRRGAPCARHIAAFCCDRRIMKKTIDSSRGTASLDL